MGKKFISSIVGLVAGAANGLFGSGGGTILVPALEKCLGVETHKAHATALAVVLPLTLVSVFFYLGKGQTPWGTILWVSSGGVLGGFIGSRLLNKITAPWLHKIFGIFMAAAAIKMIF
ncbi:MAG: sulfite exporter TauE/SafE family protein [Clostridiales bacterium]|nr:sulfite exporter TauE/SafE family protein [Clostridiales bacterium]